MFKRIRERPRNLFNNIETICIFCSEYKHKENLVDREEDDSVEYNLKNVWFFNPSLSSPLTGEEELVFPHLLILSMIKITLEQQPGAIGILSKCRQFND